MLLSCAPVVVEPKLNCQLSKICLFAFASTLLLGCNAGPSNYNVPSLKIDAELRVHPLGARSLAKPDSESYYFFFHAAILISIDHYRTKPEVPTRERLLYLETHPDGVLDRTVKREELLNGPFGSVHATKQCFYAAPLERGYSSVSVGLENGDIEREIPIELPHPPETLPELTSISLVRIFRSDPEYVVIGANYESNGELGSIHIEGAKAGKRIPMSVNDEGNHIYIKEDRQLPTTLKRYGIPPRIDLPAYLRLRTISLPSAELPEVRTVLDLHYQLDQLIRQDELRDGAMASTRFLQPSVTQEETVLNPLCEARFRKQKAMGLRTVE